MLKFTKHAEDKFDILNKYKVYFTREQIEDVVNSPDSLEIKEKFIFARKEGIVVVYQEKDGVKNILTFYPTSI